MAGKTSSEKKTASSKKVENGDAYLCEICGLQVNVDVRGEILASKQLS
jgi:hypothetical protein